MLLPTCLVICLVGNRLAQRWAGSLLHAVDASELTVTTFKEYEDLAVLLATTPKLLKSVRRKIEARRWTNGPFQTIK